MIGNKHMQQEQRQTLPDLDYALTELRGAALSSVEFVQDYIQLRFDGPCLSIFTHPVIRCDGQQVEWTQPGYADLFRLWIGCAVIDTAATNDQVLLSFADGNQLAVSLREEDKSGPEALTFQLNDERIWVV